MNACTGLPERFSSGWKGNAAIVSFLVLIMAGYYYWQLQAAERAFTSHMKEHARMVAGVIGLNAERALLSREIIEQVMETFLGNAARFVAYLDNIEPFTHEELSAFASESGLSGIRIVRKGRDVQGPADWLPAGAATCSKERICHLPLAGLYVFFWPQPNGTGFIQLGISDTRILEMGKRVGLETLLGRLRGLGGIQFIRLVPSHGAHAKTPELKLTEDTAEVCLALGREDLVVGMAARHFFERRALLKHEFFMFTGVLLILGALFSWLLFRYQKTFLNQVRQYERKLAKEQEDAALGRASAAITHEIRNPLNAISMGLQRLQIEANDLSGEHQELLDTLLGAVRRTDGIIRELKRYAHPVSPRLSPVSLPKVLDKILTLYRAPMEDAGITVDLHVDDPGVVQVDPDLISEVIENLVKNAVEAQASGGVVSIYIDRLNVHARLVMENGGYPGNPEEIFGLTEPYVTTKTRGSGLGLAIVSRIVQAHGGRLQLFSPEPGRFRVSILLPVAGPEAHALEPMDKGGRL